MRDANPKDVWGALLKLERIHAYLRVNADSGMMGPWGYVLDAKLDIEQDMSRLRYMEMRAGVEWFASKRAAQPESQPQQDAPPSEGWPHRWPKWAIKELEEIGVSVDFEGEAYNRSADWLCQRITDLEAALTQAREALTAVRPHLHAVLNSEALREQVDAALAATQPKR